MFQNVSLSSFTKIRPAGIGSGLSCLMETNFIFLIAGTPSHTAEESFRIIKNEKTCLTSMLSHSLPQSYLSSWPPRLTTSGFQINETPTMWHPGPLKPLSQVKPWTRPEQSVQARLTRAASVRKQLVHLGCCRREWGGMRAATPQGWTTGQRIGYC